MIYVLLDFEWNTAYSVRHGRFINEIIQIGAVKLDSSLNICSKFERTIHSAIAKKLSNRFIELTAITNEQMKNGVDFLTAIKEYNEWIGDSDFVTMTWSNSDLYAVFDNCKSFLSDGYKINIGKYVDLQKYVQNVLKTKGFEINSQISLEKAAQMLNINTDDFKLHTACDDSMLSARIFRETFDRKEFGKAILDTTNPKFYERLTFKSYTVSDIDSPFINKKHLCFKCESCNVRAKRVTNWKFKNRWFKAIFKCPKCSEKFEGRVSIKKTFDSVSVKKRNMPIKVRTDKNEVTV